MDYHPRIKQHPHTIVLLVVILHLSCSPLLPSHAGFLFLDLFLREKVRDRGVVSFEEGVSVDFI